MIRAIGPARKIPPNRGNIPSLLQIIEWMIPLSKFTVQDLTLAVRVVHPSGVYGGERERGPISMSNEHGEKLCALWRRGPPLYIGVKGTMPTSGG
jgi:hypothetical protein